MDLKEDGCVDVYDPTTVPETYNSGIYTVDHMCLFIPFLSLTFSLNSLLNRSLKATTGNICT